MPIRAFAKPVDDLSHPALSGSRVCSEEQLFCDRGEVPEVLAHRDRSRLVSTVVPDQHGEPIIRKPNVRGRDVAVNEPGIVEGRHGAPDTTQKRHDRSGGHVRLRREAL